MSFVLDALKKAEAQREATHAAMGIHAHAHADRAARPDADSRRVGAWTWLASCVALAMLVFAWAWWPRHGEPVGPQPPVATSASSEALRPVPLVELQPLPSRIAPSTRATEVAVRPRPAMVGLPSAGPQPAIVASQPSSAGARAEALKLPSLTITGHVYSAQASRRMLIVNGQVVSEGGQAMPGVTLVRVLSKSAVFNYLGREHNVEY